MQSQTTQPAERKNKLPALLTVGQVARRCGVAVSTLHYYESIGLIESIRSTGNQRRYPREVLRYVAIIKVAQRTGIALDTIRDTFTRLPPDTKLNARTWRQLSQGWRDELDARIQRLQHLRDRLDSCIGCGCLSLEDCPLRNPDDVLGRQGSGARLIR